MMVIFPHQARGEDLRQGQQTGRTLNKMAHNLSLRPASPADAGGFAALESVFPPEDRMSRATFRRLLAGNSCGYVVEGAPGGALLAAAVFLFRRRARVARLYSLAVAETARGQGLARQLIAAGEAGATARGCDRMRLEVRASNAPAIHLYEALGFDVIARKSGYYPDHEDALLMQRRLTASSVVT